MKQSYIFTCFVSVMLSVGLQPVSALALFSNDDCPNITGQVTYFNTASTPLYDVQVYLKTLDGEVLQVTSTDYLGNFSLCAEEPGTYQVVAVSARPTGGINSIDALMALRHYVGQITLTGLKFLAADVKNNGFINSTNALLIAKRSVELVTTFPAGDWVFETATFTVTNGNQVVQNLKGLCYGDLDGSFTPAGCTPLPTQADAGPDQTVTGTSATLAGNTPQYGTGTWSIVSGTGGNITQTGEPNAEFSGIAGNTYSLAWTISTVCSSSSDIVVITFPAPFTCGSIFTDERDGHVYNSVQIGDQCWMKENLNIGSMIISTAIYEVIHSDCSNNGIIEKYCLDNDPTNCAIYGGLYDWNEMMQYTTIPGTQGICPADWHIPTNAEWCTLTTYLDETVDCNSWSNTGTNVGGKMKEMGYDHWSSPNTGATNENGFTALGAGSRGYSGHFGGVSLSTYFWSSSVYSTTYSFYWQLFYNNANIIRTTWYKENGFSVRCVRDSSPCTPQPTQSDAGPDQTVTGTSATLAGNTPQYGTGTWSIASGTGGNITQTGEPNAEFSGIAGNTYSLVWTITTICASTSDMVNITFEPPSFTCGSSFTDIRDGRVYNTVLIGDQCWMKENLDIGIMVSDNNTGNEHSHCSNNGIFEKYCYDNDPGNCAVYGGLYDWNEIMQYTTTPGTQGICPADWHIPTDPEWCTLTTFLDETVNCNELWYSGTNAGGKIKETGTTHWSSPNTGATNESGFTALGAGYRIYFGGFYSLSDGTSFWSSSELSASNGIHWSVGQYYASVLRYDDNKASGRSVRCVRD